MAFNNWIQGTKGQKENVNQRIIENNSNILRVVNSCLY